MYFGSKKRHQQLADILEYMVISRGSIWAAGSGIQQRSDYMRIIFYTINQLLLQEHVTSFPELRRKFMAFLEGRNLECYIEDDNYRLEYDKAKKFDGALTYREHKDTYWAVDHLLPKSLGSATEFVVYLYLLRHSGGYIIP